MSEMGGWGLTNLRDPHIESVGTTVSVSIDINDVIDDSQAVFWIAPQIYRGNKVCLFLCLSVCVPLCLCACLSVRLSICWVSM